MIAGVMSFGFHVPAWVFGRLEELLRARDGHNQEDET